MKMKKFVVLSLAIMLCFGSFHAYSAYEELLIANAQASVQYAGSEKGYQYIKKFSQYFTPDIIENEFFKIGFLTDYIDTMKADGILPADYQYGSSTPAPAPAQPSAPAHEHTYKEEVTKESTCVEAGKVTKTCDCGYVTTENLPLGEHTYFENVTKEVTCTTDGEVSYLCSVCGDTYTETKAATGHTTTSGKLEVITKPTCTVDGEIALICDVCGEHTDTDVLPTQGHSKGEWEVTKKAGLISNGEQVQKCVNCGEILAMEVIPYNSNALIGVIAAVVVVIGIVGVVVYKQTRK